jgi:hypothetical protein
MSSRNSRSRNTSPDEGADQPQHGLLSVRSALVVTLALIAAGGGAVLLYAAHRPTALIALSAFGILGFALTFFDRMIE